MFYVAYRSRILALKRLVLGYQINIIREELAVRVVRHTLMSGNPSLYRQSEHGVEICGTETLCSCSSRNFCTVIEEHREILNDLHRIIYLELHILALVIILVHIHN